MANASTPTDDVASMLNNYLALLHGFIVSPEEGGGDSKLRHAITFTWWSALGCCGCFSQSDAVFEKISTLFNVALWYMNHASFVAGQDDNNMEGALEVHKCLRVASGMFLLIKKELIDQLEDSTTRAFDLNPNIIDTHIYQCTAEAQEVTVGRAIELGHNPTIVCSLAHETAKLYRLADAALAAVFGWPGHKWQWYMQFKAEIYLAYAYYYRGEVLVAQERCGDGIRCFQESQSHIVMATKAATKYSQSWDLVGTVKPHENLFFTRLAPIVQTRLEKCEYENGFIYLQTVPMATPSLGEKAAFGVATPQQFQMPPCHPLWTVEAYRAFDVKKLPGKYNKLIAPAPASVPAASASTLAPAAPSTPAPASTSASAAPVVAAAAPVAVAAVAPAAGGENVVAALTPGKQKEISQPANDPTINSPCKVS